MNRNQQIEELSRNFELIKRRLSAGFHPLIGKMDITPAQAQVLFMVKHHENCGLTEIANFLGVSKSAATQLVEPLVERGYLIRQPDETDRRAIKIKISVKSRLKMELAKKRIMKRVSKVFEVLGDNDLGELVKLSRKLIDNNSNLEDDPCLKKLKSK